MTGDEWKESSTPPIWRDKHFNTSGHLYVVWETAPKEYVSIRAEVFYPAKSLMTTKDETFLSGFYHGNDILKDFPKFKLA